MKVNLIKAKEDNLPSKIIICFNSIINGYTQDNNTNSILLSDFYEISSILNIKNNRLIYFLYMNRINIHEILYNEEKVIEIEIKEENRNLAYYFYLILLIKENKNIVNYKYSIEYLNDVNNYQKSIQENKIYKKIILAKIIIDLITNYKNFDEYKEGDEEMKKIEDENFNIINNNIKYLKELIPNYNENYMQKDIDDIYLNLLKALLQTKNLHVENTLEILNQLELKDINITSYIINELAKSFEDNNFIMIKDIDDLFNENKINVYYILLKYILKDSIFIYQIPFLLKTKKIIIKNIKNIYEKILSLNNEIKEKYEYIIKIIADSDYYYNIYFTLPKLNCILEYYKNFEFATKKEDSIIIEDKIKNKKFNDIEKYLIDYDIAQKMNERYSIIDYLIKIKNKYFFTSEIEMNRYIEEWENIEYKIKNKRIEEIEEIDIKIIDDYLKVDAQNEVLFGKIFDQEIINYFHSKIDTILSNFKENEYESDISTNSIKSVSDYNLNDNSTDQNKKYSGIEKNNKQIKDITGETSKKSFDNYKKQNLNKDGSYYSIIELKHIRSHEFTAELVKEIKGKIISCGTDNKINIYDKNSTFKKDVLKDCKDWINNIEEFEKNSQNKLNIFALTKNILYNIDFNNKKNDERKEVDKQLRNLNFFFKVDKSLILCSEDTVFKLDNLFSKVIHENLESILNGYYKEGIMINKSLCAFTSNRIISKGEDKITFFSLCSEKSCGEIKNYSFILSSTGLCLMSIDNKENNNQILFCACKKYLKGQKNGILLINDLKMIEESNNNNIKNNIKFFDTNDFEVHCFCQLISFDKNIILKNKEITKTNYFFVGGFDAKRKKGKIKLYKINKTEDEFIEIEEVQDNIIPKCSDEVKENGDKFKFNGFNGPISCIEQSKSDGNILITCWDGNVYFCNYPALEALQSFYKI